jgi:hypothetical protein
MGLVVVGWTTLAFFETVAVVGITVRRSLVVHIRGCIALVLDLHWSWWLVGTARGTCLLQW